MRLEFGEVKTHSRFMADRIDTLPPRRPRVYPWDEWMDGSAWRIRRGEDFDVAPQSMASMIRTRAGVSGRSVSTRVQGESVAFQFSLEEKVG